MLRCMLGSVKGEKTENPQGKGEVGKWKKGGELKIKINKLLVIFN